jgi:hypothetical protein
MKIYLQLRGMVEKSLIKMKEDQVVGVYDAPSTPYGTQM